MLMISRVTAGGGAMDKTTASAIRQRGCLSQHGPGVQSESSLAFVQFKAGELRLNEGTAATCRFGFAAIEGKKHLDGCLCRPQGAAFASQANSALHQVHVPRFVEP